MSALFDGYRIGKNVQRLAARLDALESRTERNERRMGVLADKVAAAQKAETDLETRVGADEATTAAKLAEDEANIVTLQKTIDDLKAKGEDTTAAEAALDALTTSLGAFHAAAPTPTPAP